MLPVQQWLGSISFFSPRYIYTVFFVAAGILILCLLIIKEILKPLHLQRSCTGRNFNLPPGPSGSPIVGNLIQFFKARRNEVDLLSYVSRGRGHPEVCF